MADSFAAALGQFRATVRPLTEQEQRVIDITNAEFDRLFADGSPAVVTESPACATHAKPLGARAEIAAALGHAQHAANKAAGS